jgi:hypothetical protein
MDITNTYNYQVMELGYNLNVLLAQIFKVMRLKLLAKRYFEQAREIKHSQRRLRKEFE